MPFSGDESPHYSTDSLRNPWPQGNLQNQWWRKLKPESQEVWCLVPAPTPSLCDKLLSFWTAASLPAGLGGGRTGRCLYLSSWPFHVDALCVSLSFSSTQIPEPTGQAPRVLHLGKTPLGVWQNIAARWGRIMVLCMGFGACTGAPISHEAPVWPGSPLPIGLGCLSHHLGCPQQLDESTTSITSHISPPIFSLELKYLSKPQSQATWTCYPYDGHCHHRHRPRPVLQVGISSHFKNKNSNSNGYNKNKHHSSHQLTCTVWQAQALCCGPFTVTTTLWGGCYYSPCVDGKLRPRGKDVLRSDNKPMKESGVETWVFTPRLWFF